jgi:hypothetical protein
MVAGGSGDKVIAPDFDTFYNRIGVQAGTA